VEQIIIVQHDGGVLYFMRRGDIKKRVGYTLHGDKRIRHSKLTIQLVYEQVIIAIGEQEYLL